MDKLFMLFWVLTIVQFGVCYLAYRRARRTRSLSARDHGWASVIHGVVMVAGTYVPALPALVALASQTIVAVGGLLSVSWLTRIGQLMAIPRTGNSA